MFVERIYLAGLFKDGLIRYSILYRRQLELFGLEHNHVFVDGAQHGVDEARATIQETTLADIQAHEHHQGPERHLVS